MLKYTRQGKCGDVYVEISVNDENGKPIRIKRTYMQTGAEPVSSEICRKTNPKGFEMAIEQERKCIQELLEFLKRVESWNTGTTVGTKTEQMTSFLINLMD